MRATLIVMILLSLTAAPMVAAWPAACTHGAPAMAEGAEHGAHASMTMDEERDSEGPCHCEPGCAEHCDAASPAALLGIDRPDRPAPTVSTPNATVRSLHDDPPRGAPLRPPQTRSR